jgi:hypothetical protein
VFRQPLQRGDGPALLVGKSVLGVHLRDRLGYVAGREPLAGYLLD